MPSSFVVVVVIVVDQQEDSSTFSKSGHKLHTHTHTHTHTRTCLLTGLLAHARGFDADKRPCLQEGAVEVHLTRRTGCRGAAHRCCGLASVLSLASVPLQTCAVESRQDVCGERVCFGGGKGREWCCGAWEEDRDP